MTNPSKTTMRRHLNNDGIYFSNSAQQWVWVGGPQSSAHYLGSLENAYEAWLDGRVGDSTYDTDALDNAVHNTARADRALI